MALSNDLVSQFAKLTNTKNENKETTVKATYVQKVNGVSYVRLDGANSDILTPVKTTVDAEPGDKVSVLIKDHAATIIGNISSPSARSTVVENLRENVDEQGNTIQQLDNVIIQQGNSIIQMNNSINQQQTTINQHNTKINQQEDTIVSLNNTIIQQNNNIDSMNNTIVEHGNQINSIGNTVDQQGNIISQHNNIISQYDNRITQNKNDIIQQGNIINQQGDHINSINNRIDSQDNVIYQQGNIIRQQGDNITSINNTINEQNNIINLHSSAIDIADSDIQILNSAFVIKDGVLIGLKEAIIDKIKTDYLDSAYADIDFANITTAAVQNLFSDSGIIKDLVVQQGKITGELVGVTINGDRIIAKTITADSILLNGMDGVLYELNLDKLNNINISEVSKFNLLNTKPDDWETNYKKYYQINNNKYVHLTGDTAPQWTANTYYKLSADYETALDGSNIVANSITADKIAVTDLVAFGATIGGFQIDNNSIHTIGKSTVSSLAAGIYMDNSGNFSLGDDENYIVYQIDPQTGKSTLIMSSDDFFLGKKQRYLSDELDEITDNTTTFLHIESSNGLAFRQNNVNTVLSVYVFRGPDRITDINTLRQKMGNDVYLQWKYKQTNESTYHTMVSSDPKISENGFKLTLTPQDVDSNVTFICEIVN